MNALASSSPNRFSLQLRRVARFPHLRVLTWRESILYAGRGYDLVRANVSAGNIPTDSQAWEKIASFHPALWRRATARMNLTARLARDGFHALAVLPSGNFVGAVPGAIVTLVAGDREFRVTRRITRGTRPLHITALPDGTVLWGEYFDNPSRDEVHIYSSSDGGLTWGIAYTFPRGAIRHVHNIVCDPWAQCLWILTGDYGDECRIMRASCDLRQVEVVLQGSQQTRSAAIVACEEGLYFSSDTPLEKNSIYFLDRQGKVSTLASINGSSIYGCRAGNSVFFSTMVEPSAEGTDQHARLYGGAGKNWCSLLAWKKDQWPMGLFQYGNVFLPDGENATPYLALTTVAVRSDDCVTSIYTVES